MSNAEFTLNGNLEELGRLAEETARFCERNGLPSDVEFDLNLVLEELFTNSVRHGGCRGLPEAAAVRLEAAGGDTIVRFADRGTAYNPLNAPVPDVNAPLEDRTPGGLGIHLVRQIMQDLTYERSEGWNRLSMRRRVPTAAPES